MRATLLAASLVILSAVPAAAQELDCSEPFGGAVRLACAGEFLAEADAELNRAYSAARDQARRFDAVRKTNSGKPLADLLLAGQRRWLGFRDASCLAEGEALTGNAREAIASETDCKTRLTRDHTEALRTFASRVRGVL